MSQLADAAIGIDQIAERRPVVMLITACRNGFTNQRTGEAKAAEIGDRVTLSRWA
ncbi:MAG: hypothetical protein NXH85_17560 [Pseudomonadaceae bacterium]|nr:hypothetical protein [Pseudomonadaceae bacterium]